MLPDEVSKCTHGDRYLRQMTSCLASRTIRVSRVVRVIRFLPGIQRMIAILATSAPALVTVGLLMCIIIYVYAIVAMNLFGQVAFGEYINEQANFASFGMAVLTLVRCITGESYNGLMHDAMVSESRSAPGRCSEAQGNCGTMLAVPFFVSFQIIGVQVVLQLILAAILDTFTAETQSRAVRSVLCKTDCWPCLARGCCSSTRDAAPSLERNALHALQGGLGVAPYEWNHEQPAHHSLNTFFTCGASPPVHFASSQMPVLHETWQGTSCTYFPRYSTPLLRRTCSSTRWCTMHVSAAAHAAISAFYTGEIAHGTAVRVFLRLLAGPGSMRHGQDPVRCFVGTCVEASCPAGLWRASHARGSCTICAHPQGVHRPLVI